MRLEVWVEEALLRRKHVAGLPSNKGQRKQHTQGKQMTSRSPEHTHLYTSRPKLSLSS